MLLGWIVFAVGLIGVGVSLPVDGVFGVALALIGIVALWFGWSMIVRPQGGNQ